MAHFEAENSFHSTAFSENRLLIVIRNGTLRASLPFLLVALGGTLRFYGLSFGLPYSSNFYVRPDESLLVIPALELFSNGGDPKYYGYPAATIILQALCMRLYWLVSLYATHASGQSIVEHFFSQTEVYWLLCRTVSACVGTLTVALMYRVARCCVQRTAATWATLLFAVAPLAVRDSHFAVSDTLLTALLYLCIYQLIRIAKTNRSTPILVGITFGAALATKYNAIFLAPIVGLVLLSFGPQHFVKRMRSLGLAVLSSLLTFAILNPFMLLNHTQFSGAMGEISQMLYGESAGLSIAFIDILALGIGSQFGLLLAGAGVLCAILAKEDRGSLCIILGSSASPRR